MRGTVDHDQGWNERGGMRVRIGRTTGTGEVVLAALSRDMSFSVINTEKGLP